MTLRPAMIIHCDMDAYYASVEERDNPALVGKPVIVGGNPQRRGVVCAANYVARKFGIHSAMPAATAHRLCPHAVFLPSRMDHYAEVSRQIRDIFHRYTPLVEPLSLDEAFLDVTGSQGLFGPAADIGRQVKQAIRGELNLVASVDVAPNKFLAKIASDLDKPDGFVVVDPGVRHLFPAWITQIAKVLFRRSFRTWHNNLLARRRTAACDSNPASPLPCYANLPRMAQSPWGWLASKAWPAATTRLSRRSLRECSRLGPCCARRPHRSAHRQEEVPNRQQ